MSQNGRENTHTRDAASAALEYRERGWSPIPIKVRSKAPKLSKDHPFLSRRATDEEFGRFDFRYNVGIVAGRVSGIIVLDDDGGGGEPLKSRGWNVPPTPTVKTARGHQYYFRCPPEGFPTFDVARKLEVRGDGAYVVAPPSIHPGGARYEWVISPEDAALADPPEWLVEKARRRGRRMRAEDVGETIANGSRNKTLLSIAGTLRRRGLDEASIASALLGINATKCETPLAEDEVRKIAHSAARYEPTEILRGALGAGSNEHGPHRSAGRGRGTTRALTDLGNSERLVERHGEDLRYCHAWKKWLVWDGKRWCVDDRGAVREWTKETVRSIYGEAAVAEDDSTRKVLADHARRSEARQRLEAMISLAESSVPITPDELDADPWLLNVENGTLDLRSGELREHSRDDLITKIAGGPYRPEAEAPRFERFLREVLVEEELVAFVKRFAGYSLSGSTSERVFAILWGSGKNGKTTLVELLRDALGDYAKNTDVETILRKRHTGVGNDVAALKGARFVSSAEVEQGRSLAESKVKNLTGRDTVTARFLFAEPFDFRPEFKLWLSTNNKPVIYGTDDAIWDRIRLVPFTQRFEGERADSRLPDALRAEVAGVLAWMVRGCLEWQREGLGMPEKVRVATEGYRAEMDTLAAFIEDRCVTGDGVWVEFKKLFAAWEQWCQENHEASGSSRKFATTLTQRGFEKDSGTNNVAIRRGIALRHDGDPDPSRINDPEPDPDPDRPEPQPEEEENVNPINDEPEIVNSENPCKSQDSSKAINEVNEESTTSEENPLVRQGSGKSLINVNSLIPDDPDDEDAARVRALLDDPPAWLAASLAKCREQPERYTRPTSSSIAHKVFGTSTRWREVQPILEAWLEAVK